MKNPHISKHLCDDYVSKTPKGEPWFPGGSCVTVRLLARSQEPVKNDPEMVHGIFDSIGVVTSRFPTINTTKIDGPFKDDK